MRILKKGWQKGALRITQQDIRALQMAKAAVCAGVELLMEALEIGTSDVEQVFLAGASGIIWMWKKRPG